MRVKMIRDNVVIQRDGVSGYLIGMRLQLEGDKVNQVELWPGEIQAIRRGLGTNYTYPVFFENFLYCFSLAKTHFTTSQGYRVLRLPSPDGRPSEAELFKISPKQTTWTVPDHLRNSSGARPFGWYYAGPAVADGYFFHGNDSLGMTVLKLAGEKTAVVAENFMDLGIRSTPFFQGNRMYVRSHHYLYCIGPAPVPGK